MYNHAINKQVFEFNCSSEVIAENIQKEFINYTIPQINDLISDILSGQVSEDSTLAINEIEIDLGDVNIQSFGKVDMLNKFKTILSEKIANIQNSSRGVATVDTASGNQVAAYDTNLEITKSFILHKDLPWWMDKSMAADQDAILKELITKNPQAVKLFLESQRSDKTILSRIATQYKPSTKAVINALIPGFLTASFNTMLLEEYFDRNKVSSAHSFDGIEKLMPGLYKNTTTSADTRKALLIRQLLKGNNFNWINDLVLFNFFSAEELRTAYAFLPDDSKISRHAKMRVTKLLKKLSILQVEFLCQYVPNKTRPSYQRFYPVNNGPDGFNTDTTGSAEGRLNKPGENVRAYLNTNVIILKDDKEQQRDTAFSEERNTIVNDHADKSSSNRPDLQEQKVEESYVQGDSTDEPIPGYIEENGNQPNPGNMPTANEIATNGETKEIKNIEINQAVTNIAKVNLTVPGITPPANKPAADEEKGAKVNLSVPAAAPPGNKPAAGEEKGAVINSSVAATTPPGNKPAAGEEKGAVINLTVPPVTPPGNNPPAGEEKGAVINSSVAATAPPGNKPADGEEQGAVINLSVPAAALPGNNTPADAEQGAVINLTVPAVTPPGNKPAAGKEKGAVTNLTVPSATPAGNKRASNEEKGFINPGGNITKANAALDNPENNAVQEKGMDKPLFSQSDENSGQPIPGITLPFSESATREELKASGKRDRFDYGIEATGPVKGIKQEKEISFVLKGLGGSSEALLDYLKKLNKTDLYKLKKAFTRHIQKDFERRKKVNSLLEQPYFLRYNLLQLFAGLSFPETGPHIISTGDPAGNFHKPQRAGLNNLIRKIKLSQSLVLTTLNNLPPKEIMILQDISQKKVFNTRSEKSLMRKILLKFPEEAVFLLHSLTELPENELLNLMQAGGKISSVNSPSHGDKYFSAYKNDMLQKYHIANAGLCLIAPYLSTFFDRLGYLENRVFKNKFIATRALFILQHMASGNYKAPEYLLQLNKVLTGFNMEEGITIKIRLTKKEMTEADNLIQSVITNWQVLKSTTVQGFRESFLGRKGILFQNELSWTLQVEKKGFDLLLNTIPWGFNIIKLPWMKKMLQVEW